MPQHTTSAAPDPEAFRRLVEEFTDQGLFIVARDRRILSWNAGAAHITGYSAADAVGQSLDFLFRSPLKGEIAQPFDMLANAHAGPWTASRYLRRKDGRLTEVEIRVVILAACSKLGDLGVMLRWADTPSQAGAGLTFESDLLQAAVDGTSDAVFVKGLDGCYLLVNRAAAAFVGKPAEEVLGRDDTALLDHDGAMSVMAHDRAVVDSGHCQTSEEVVMAAGVSRTFLSTKSPYRNRAGEIAGVLGIARDITDRKAIESELRAKSEQYRLALDAAELGTWKHDLKTDEIWLDERCQAHHGVTRSILKTSELFDIIHRDDAQRVSAHVATMRNEPAAAEGLSIDVRVVRGDGEIRWLTVRARANFVPHGGVLCPTHVIGTTLDITERKLAEQQLAASEQKFRELADAIPQIVWTAAPDGSVDHLNARVAEFTGIDTQELTGWSWERVIHPDDLAETRQAWTQILQTTEPRDVEYRIRRADGPYRWHVTRSIPGRDAQGAVTRWYGTCTDIEDLKRAEHAILWQNRVMERMAAGDPLLEVLDLIVELIEDQLPDTICSILLHDRGEGRLRFGSGRNVPASYSQAIDGVRIGPAVGSCGTAAFRSEIVAVADIATDPLWSNYRDLALMHELRSCWSVPIFGGGKASGKRNASDVLGTFAVYKRETAEPEPAALEVIVRAAYLAGIAIERDTAAVALQASEKRFRDLVELAPDAVAIVQQGRIAYANQAAARLVGVKSPDVLIGVLLSDFMHADDAAASLNRQEMILASDLPVPLRQFRVRRSDGTWMVMESCAGPCRHNGQPAIQLIARDVSERTRTEIALRDSEERFRQIAGAFEHVFWMVSYPEIRVLYVSSAFESVWGRTSAELYANPAFWQEGIAVQDRQRVQEHYSRWLLDPVVESFEVEYRVVRPDGQIRWVFDRGTAIHDEHGSVYRLTGVAQDITEKKLLETQFRQSQKMEAVGQLAGGIAHDFNNLLMVVSGFSELLLEDEACTLRQREAVSAIRDAGIRAASLTRQLLAFSRKQLLEPVTLDLNELIRQAESMIRRVIREDLEVHVVLAADLHRITADPAQIDQVLLNLVLNARDAMPVGGRLTIETDNAEESPGVQMVRLRVSDTGMGMTETARSKIFEPFFTTKPIGQGTGLGMAVVHGIVSQSGGQIRVESELGIGTTVVLLLPVTHSLPATPKAAARSVANVRGVETILLAEDEPAVRRIVRSSLELQGYTVLEAEHGASALGIARRHQGTIELLLTDMVMPLMGGRQLAEIITAQRPGLRVLYMSGYSDDESLQLGVESSTLHLLQKPFDPDVLVKKVREVLDQTPAM